MRLFIIGNGFDLDHKLKSKYMDFKEFLEENYLPSFNRGLVTFPNVGIGKDGEEVVDPNSAAQIIYSLISHVSSSIDWCDFEKCLGELDYQEVLDLIEEDEDNPFRYYNNLEDIVSGLKSSMILVISNLFCEWVSKIDISKAKRKYSFSKNDLFLTFNYTSILEKTYDIPRSNICHIHGSSEDGFCIVGHGNDERTFDEYDDIISFQVSEIHNLLKKSVENLYYEKQPFFQKVYESEISEIVFFGLSLSDIDLYYVRRIFDNLETRKIGILLSKYESRFQMKEKIEIIIKAGFKGQYLGCFDEKNNF